MRLEIRRKGVSIAASMREYVADHLTTALDRFAQQIGLVKVWLSDVNGPRGGVDKQCLIAVHLAGGKTIRAGHADTRFTAAINLATDRVAYAVGRALKRRRDRTARTRPWESEPEA